MNRIDNASLKTKIKYILFSVLPDKLKTKLAERLVFEVSKKGPGENHPPLKGYYKWLLYPEQAKYTEIYIRVFSLMDKLIQAQKEEKEKKEE